MVRAPSSIRFTRGRSARFVARPALVSGRSPAAPRWSPAAARAAVRALEDLAHQHHLRGWVQMLGIVLRPQEDWEWWRRKLARFASRLCRPAVPRSCSGSDFFAEALDARRGKDWVYLHAAEADAVPRNVLARAWGLIEEDRIFRDAASPEAAAAPECDLFVPSPDCVDFSKRRHGRDDETRVSSSSAPSQSPACWVFFNERKAAVAVIVNVDELDGVGFITDLLAELQGYAWRSQAINSLTSAGVPVHRHRCCWVGTRL
ncbi:MAG: hypothetical protein SGPRY_009653 [Prymnesium sp.]